MHILKKFFFAIFHIESVCFDREVKGKPFLNSDLNEERKPRTPEVVAAPGKSLITVMGRQSNQKQ